MTHTPTVVQGCCSQPPEIIWNGITLRRLLRAYMLSFRVRTMSVSSCYSFAARKRSQPTIIFHRIVHSLQQQIIRVPSICCAHMWIKHTSCMQLEHCFPRRLNRWAWQRRYSQSRERSHIAGQCTVGSAPHASLNPYDLSGPCNACVGVLSANRRPKSSGAREVLPRCYVSLSTRLKRDKLALFSVGLRPPAVCKRSSPRRAGSVCSCGYLSSQRTIVTVHCCDCYRRGGIAGQSSVNALLKVQCPPPP